MGKRLLSLVIIIPVFEDRESATQLLENLAKHLKRPVHIVLVEDGSVRAPSTASMISDAGLSGEVLHLSRNVGHQRAIATGLCYVANTYEVGATVVMDADGEDRPEAIVPLLERLNDDKVDAVTAKRGKRSESLGFRTFNQIYRFFFSVLTGRRITFGNFVALSPQAVRRLSAMHETWVHFPASLIVSRLRLSSVDTDRGARYAGRSQMNFVSLTLHGMRSMMVFADSVLVRVVLVCALLIGLVVVLFIALTTMKISGVAIPGWFSVGSGILVSLLLQAGILTFVTLMISGTMQSTVSPDFVQVSTLIDRISVTERGE